MHCGVLKQATMQVAGTVESAGSKVAHGTSTASSTAAGPQAIKSCDVQFSQGDAVFALTDYYLPSSSAGARLPPDH